MTAAERRTKRLVRLRAPGQMCEVCAVRPGQSVHHRLPVSHGGPWCPSNCLLVCGHGTLGCHGWIEHNRAASYAAGWLVKSGLAVPAEVPVRLRLHGGLVLLDAEGDFQRLEQVGAWTS